MKKISQKYFGQMLLTAALVLTTAAAVPAAEPDEQYTVDVILKTTASEYWGYVMAGAEGYMKDHPNVTVVVKGASSETAYEEQAAMIEADLKDETYDAFVIAPLKEEDVVKAIEGVSAPVIALDTEIEAEEIRSFVGTCNEDAARLGAEKAVEAAENAGWTQLDAICISGVEGDNTVAARLAGYAAGINSSGGNFLADETVYAEAVADKAAEAMEAIMEKYPDGIAIICANNDDMAIAAARAAKDHEAYANTVFIGFDGIQSACEAILNGEETLSVSQDAYGMGYQAVEAAMKAVGGEVPDDCIYVDHAVIDQENAGERLEQLQAME